ncbi:hypothetical protein PMIN06_010992 [Paraphaeosphaeria minitans]
MHKIRAATRHPALPKAVLPKAKSKKRKHVVNPNNPDGSTRAKPPRLRRVYPRLPTSSASLTIPTHHVNGEPSASSSNLSARTSRLCKTLPTLPTRLLTTLIHPWPRYSSPPIFPPPSECARAPPHAPR